MLKKGEQPIPCFVDGCKRKTRTFCPDCTAAVCEEHRNESTHKCFQCQGEPKEDDDDCEICGADRHDGCECHENMLGFPENCSRD